MNYRQHIAALLRQLCDSGLTHRQIADQLGFANGNVVSMHMSAGASISPYPLKRLRALVEVCGMNSSSALKLVAKRARCHPDNPTEVDLPTILWLVRITVAAVDLQRGAVAGLPGVCHG